MDKMKKKKECIPIILCSGSLASFLLGEPWNILIGGLIVMPCTVYLVWELIENRNRNKRK